MGVNIMGRKGLQQNRGTAIQNEAPIGDQIISSLFPLYKEDALARGLSPTTLNTVRCDMTKLTEWMAEKKIKDLDQLSPRALKEFQTWLAKRIHDVPGRPKDRMKPASRAKVLANLRSFFRWCYRVEQTATDLSRHLISPKVPLSLPREIPRLKEIARLIRAQLRRKDNQAEGQRDAAIIAVLFACGLRRMELVGLKVEDVDLDEREVRVVKGKGNKNRTVPLAVWARDLVACYLKQGRAAFRKDNRSANLFIRADGKGLYIDQINRVFPEWLRRARLNRRFTPHALRHAFCVYLLKGGASIRIVNELAGHRKLSVTARYLRLTTGDLAKVLQESHPGWRS